MRAERPLLILHDAEDRFTVPGDNPLAAVNPAFLESRGITALGSDGNLLLVSMADSGDTAAIAALKFATGREISAVQPDPDGPGAAGSLSGPQPIEDTRHPPQRASLFDRILDWLRVVPDRGPTLVTLATLLQAEGDAALAGRAACAIGTADESPAAQLAALLEQGVALAPALALSHGQENWLALALASAPEAAHRDLFSGLVAAEARLDSLHEGEVRLQVEVVLLAMPVVLAWLALSPFAGALALAGTAAGLAALRKAHAAQCESDSVRARVLSLAASLIAAGCDRAGAMHAAMRRLQDLVPTWGALPDNAEGLARALRLDRQQQALLHASDMQSGLRLLAGQCEDRAARGLERRSWLARLSMVAAFGAAMALLQQ